MSETPAVECSLCGRDGYPSPHCSLCHGRAKAQSRAYTLSEERSDPKSRPKRYGPGGEVGPKIINVPGSDTQFGN